MGWAKCCIMYYKQLDGPQQTLVDEWVTVFVNVNGKATPKMKDFKVMGQSLYLGNELVQEKVIKFFTDTGNPKHVHCTYVTNWSKKQGP